MVSWRYSLIFLMKSLVLGYSYVQSDIFPPCPSKARGCDSNGMRKFVTRRMSD